MHEWVHFKPLFGMYMLWYGGSLPEPPLLCCSLKPGDLVLFMQTRDPKIYCALLYTEKVRVFLDKVSLEQHEKDIKQSR